MNTLYQDQAPSGHFRPLLRFGEPGDHTPPERPEGDYDALPSDVGASALGPPSYLPSADIAAPGSVLLGAGPDSSGSYSPRRHRKASRNRTGRRRSRTVSRRNKSTSRKKSKHTSRKRKSKKESRRKKSKKVLRKRTTKRISRRR